MPLLDHEGNEMEFRRRFGGLGWPGEKPGFAVVLAEENRMVVAETWPLSSTTSIHYHLLAEYETWDMADLISKAIEFRARYGIQAFYARRYKPAMGFLDEYNRTAHQRRLAPFYFQEPPAVDERNERGRIEYHIRILQDLLKEGILHKSELEGKKLYNYLIEVPQNELQKATDLKYPGPAALGYVCCAMRLMPTEEELQEERRMCEAILAKMYEGED